MGLLGCCLCKLNEFSVCRSQYILIYPMNEQINSCLINIDHVIDVFALAKYYSLNVEHVIFVNQSFYYLIMQFHMSINMFYLYSKLIIYCISWTQ